MSDAHSCYDKSLSQSLTRSSRSSASSCLDLLDQTCQHTADLYGSASAAQPGTSSLSSDFQADMSELPDDIKHIEHALHCEEEHFMSSPQNSDASAFSCLDAAFLSSPWSWSQQLARPTAQVTAPTSPCLAEVPTEAIHETVNVACLGRAGHIDPDARFTIYRLGETYGFSPLMIALGTHYFRRLAHSNFIMLQVAAHSPEFSAFVVSKEQYPVPRQPYQPLAGAVHANFLNDEAWLTLIHLTCIYLAAKVLEYVPCKDMLQTIMSHIYDYPVATQWVEQLEREVCSALEWRLGPVYSTKRKA